MTAVAARFGGSGYVVVARTAANRSSSRASADACAASRATSPDTRSRPSASAACAFSLATGQRDRGGVVGLEAHVGGPLVRAPARSPRRPSQSNDDAVANLAAAGHAAHDGLDHERARRPSRHATAASCTARVGQRRDPLVGQELGHATGYAAASTGRIARATRRYRPLGPAT